MKDVGPSVSVVVPVLNAARWLPALLPALEAQEPTPPVEVLLVDSGSTDGTAAFAGGRVRVLPLDRFTHGRSRNTGARAAVGDLVVFLSQDACPADAHWLERLIAPLGDPAVAAAYSRQEPRPDASPMERFFLQKRFPAGPPVRRRLPAGRDPGLEDVFFSNVSSAVRRSLLLAHPFDEELIMSEDQQLARDLLLAGHELVYASDSIVLHSHNYTLVDVFRRYFDSVYSLTQIFPSHGMGTSAAMGVRYLLEEAAEVARRHPLSLPYYVCYTAAKSAGTLLGHWGDRLPLSVLRRVSLHRYHWESRTSAI